MKTEAEKEQEEEEAEEEESYSPVEIQLDKALKRDNTNLGMGLVSEDAGDPLLQSTWSSLQMAVTCTVTLRFILGVADSDGKLTIVGDTLRRAAQRFEEALLRAVTPEE